MGGITTSDNAIKCLGIGASAVSICTVVLRKPERSKKNCWTIKHLSYFNFVSKKARCIIKRAFYLLYFAMSDNIKNTSRGGGVVFR